MSSSCHYQPGKQSQVAAVLLCPGQKEEEKCAPAQGDTGTNLEHLLRIMRDKYKFDCRDRYDLTITNASSKVHYEGQGSEETSMPSKFEVFDSKNLDRLARELHQVEKLIICFSSLAQQAVHYLQENGKLKCGVRVVDLPHIGNKGLNNKYPDRSLPSDVSSQTGEEKRLYRIQIVACCLYEQISDMRTLFTSTSVPLRMHPRVFSALGADLVTSDVVAVIELVKNSYDAYANEVWVRLGREEGESYLEVEDDGHGMTRAVVTDVWCLVATPYKERNREVAGNGGMRRVTGAKGLGRLSVGRLGERLTLLTKAKDHPCWEVDVNWSDLAKGEELDDSTVELRQRPPNALPRQSGTLLRVHGLQSAWDDKQTDDLKDNLQRLISPFRGVEDFKIFLTTTTDKGEQTEPISSPHFLAEPKYWVRGGADKQGDISACYVYRSISTKEQRQVEIDLPWKRISERTGHATCGEFNFDIRAWDISDGGTQEIAQRYNLQKRHVRSAIKAHKGISVYRDGVLVLPKSENARDWLGLDLRRVSRVGDRVSTNQLVGYVSITADGNPGIQDTSDRERLVSSPEVSDFEIILRAVVGELEKERDQDRTKEAKETPMEDLLGRISAQEAVEEVRVLAASSQPVRKALPVVRRLEKSLASTRKNIERRFVYYSRLATIGTIAQMLVHEIRNRTTAVGRFLRVFEQGAEEGLRTRLRSSFKMANTSIKALERLADVFSPLARRSFQRGSHGAILEDRLEACLLMQAEQRLRGQIKCQVPKSRTPVAVHPGELDAVILNLVTNSIYWLQEVETGARKICFEVRRSDVEPNRVLVRVLDTGPGISPDDMERVFWPGVTRKPNGIGMGLTVAAEVVHAYGGRMAAEDVDSGACLTFDLPLSRSGSIRK